MESQQTWQGNTGIINLWERVGIAYLGGAPRQGESLPVSDLDLAVDAFEPPISLDDYLIEHRMRADATSIDELTVRQALMRLGLSQRAHQYPEWVRAEGWLFMALRIERCVAAVEILARAHDLGLSQPAIEQARVRLGVITTRRPGVAHGGERWQLPTAIAERGTPGDVDPRWRRFQYAK
jgi:hypothetical protein